MSIAFVFLTAEVGFENKVLNELKLPCVKEVYPIFGIYDIIVKINADSPEQLKEIISSNIRNLSNVQSTITLFVKEG